MRGFLLKDGDGEHVLRAVQRVVAGEEVLDGPIAATLGQQQYGGSGHLRRYADGSPALSAAEREVLGWMARDSTYEEIAASLGRATGTVRNQAAAVQEKLDVGSRQQAVLRALQLGILQLKDLEIGR